MTGDNDNKVMDMKRESRGLASEGDDFLPETDFGRELWALRQKAIAEGMTLLSGDEIAEEITADASGCG
jgi:hypothetical protein